MLEDDRLGISLDLVLLQSNVWFLFLSGKAESPKDTLLRSVFNMISRFSSTGGLSTDSSGPSCFLHRVVQVSPIDEVEKSRDSVPPHTSAGVAGDGTSRRFFFFFIIACIGAVVSSTTA
jgi:hypothetical protein